MTDLDQPLDYLLNQEKVYTPMAVRVGSFLGGPLVAGYFIAQNFKALGDYQKINKTWIITIIFTIALFVAILLVPVPERIPKIIIPLIYSWIAYYLTKHYQGTQLTQHAANGGQNYSWWRVIVASLIGLAVLIIALFFIIAVTGV